MKNRSFITIALVSFSSFTSCIYPGGTHIPSGGPCRYESVFASGEIISLSENTIIIKSTTDKISRFSKEHIEKTVLDSLKVGRKIEVYFEEIKIGTCIPIHNRKTRLLD